MNFKTVSNLFIPVWQAWYLFTIPNQYVSINVDRIYDIGSHGNEYAELLQPPGNDIISAYHGIDEESLGRLMGLESIAGLIDDKFTREVEFKNTNDAGLVFVQEKSGADDTGDFNPISRDPRPYWPTTGNSFEVIEYENKTDKDAMITVRFEFPIRTNSTTHIVFIVISLPPGYEIPVNGPLECIPRRLDDNDNMPQLECSAYRIKNRKNLTHIVITSKDRSKPIPLGRHAFTIGIHTPAIWQSVEHQQHWWYATFRFTGGHYITKQFENRRLTDTGNCVWSKWRQETPCSATCGGGYKIYTRILYSGPRWFCNKHIMKIPCNEHPCSISCHLEPWQVLLECTLQCGATIGNGYRVSIRRVKLEGNGGGLTCQDVYPWDAVSMSGWSDQLKAVIKLDRCDAKYSNSCDNALGCRVERFNLKTIPYEYPWGVCPFPCGGFGRITSIVQVANGIPKWIGERDFGSNFESPCRSDKEPIVQTDICNAQPCEDCSAYIETGSINSISRIWVFFLNTQESDTLAFLSPEGIEYPTFKKNPFACPDVPSSFGPIRACQVSTLEHHPNRLVAKITTENVIRKPSEWMISKNDINGPHPDDFLIPEKLPSGSTNYGISKPEWFSLPIKITSNSGISSNQKFQLFVYSSNSLREPEVFTCPLKTILDDPNDCRLDIKPENPHMCQACNGQLIDATIRFIPETANGKCLLPAADRLPNGKMRTIQVNCHHICGSELFDSKIVSSMVPGISKKYARLAQYSLKEKQNKLKEELTPAEFLTIRDSFPESTPDDAPSNLYETDKDIANLNRSTTAIVTDTAVRNQGSYNSDNELIIDRTHKPDLYTTDRHMNDEYQDDQKNTNLMNKHNDIDEAKRNEGGMDGLDEEIKSNQTNKLKISESEENQVQHVEDVGIGSEVDSKKRVEELIESEDEEPFENQSDEDNVEDEID